MLLLPFVENAFKHGIDTAQDCFIDILLKVERNQLSFVIENSLPFKIESTKDTSSGIGLQNVKRRLKLLYPDAHLLIADKLDKTFIVSLQLKLPSNELHIS
jgi:sensor histidine kinase YesM